MSRLARFSVPLVLILAGTVHAQESQAAPQQVSNTQVSPAPPSMSAHDAAMMRANILMARKEYGQAVNAYNEILVKEPKNSDVMDRMGVAFQQLGALNHAAHCYKNSMKADKLFASPVNNLGTIEYEKNHYGKAINLYKKALPLTAHTEQATVYSNLGYAYFGNREYPEAMDSFGKALAIDPGVFERRGGAGSVIQQRTTTDPGLFYFFVAKSYAQAGDAERAAHYLKLARDDEYKDFLSAQTDPAFAKVIKDPRVQEVLQVPPSYATDQKKPVSN
jgi:tetratricopeptide (TPR) repeat protein